MKYSKSLVKEICDLLATGQFTIADTCTKVGITESTFYYWKEKKSEFLEAVKAAEKKRLESFGQMALSGLATLLVKHEFEEVHTEYENDKNGKPKVKGQKRVKKQVMPNTTAVIFTLTNRIPEDWKHQSNIDHTTKGESMNKGFYDAIMNLKKRE